MDSNMALSGATPHALLGLLSIQPMSGYDMRQLIPESIGHFWNESYGQIYPALRRLTEAGLVEKQTETQTGKPDRNVYTLTPAGMARLQEWLQAPARREPIRDELLLKLFFGAHVPVAVSRAQVEGFLEASERSLSTYEHMTAALRRDCANDPQQPFWLITLNRGRHDARARIAWARETLETLKTMEARDGA